jgi:hypothetical protein
VLSQKQFSRDELTRTVRVLLDSARVAAGSYAA